MTNGTKIPLTSCDVYHWVKSPILLLRLPTKVACLAGSRAIYWFSIAAITNYYKGRGLNNTNVLSYSSGRQKYEMGFTGLKSRCW